MRCRRNGRRRAATPAKPARWTIWAETYSDMGQGPKALDYFNQALPMWRETGEHGGEALTLNNMARTYADLGKKQKSLESYNQALAIWREVGNRQGEASTLNNMGRVYSRPGAETDGAGLLQPGTAHLA